MRNSCLTLDRDQAVKEAGVVARVVAGWKKHFKRSGVTDNDIDLYAEQIDRPFLKDQREEFSVERLTRFCGDVLTDRERQISQQVAAVAQARMVV